MRKKLERSRDYHESRVVTKLVTQLVTLFLMHIIVNRFLFYVVLTVLIFKLELKMSLLVSSELPRTKHRSVGAIARSRSTHFFSFTYHDTKRPLLYSHTILLSLVHSPYYAGFDSPTVIQP